jgi:PAS domain S-box-containing protein
LLLLTPLLLWVGRAFANQLAHEQRIRTQHILELDADAVQRSFDQIKGKLASLAQFVADQTAGGKAVDTERFRTFSAGLHASSTWIRAFQIVSDGAITHVYPVQGNEAALGYDLLKDPRPIIGGDVIRALQTGRVTLTGPVDLVQGGLGIIVRQPLPRTEAQPARLVAIVLNIAPLLADAGISASGSNEVRLALRGEPGIVFFGSPAVFEDRPVTRRLSLPDVSWEMGASPIQGWAASVSHPVMLFYLAGATITFLVCLLVFVLARSRENLGETVREKTEALREELAERKRTEEALRESERHYQTLADVSPVGIFRTDAQGLTTYVNARWCQISGLSAADALGDGWLRAVHPDDREELSQGWQIATGAQRTSDADYRLLHPDGTISWVMGQSVPERDQAGRVAGYVGTLTDVTERRRVEETLRVSERKFQSVFDQAAVGVVIAEGLDGRYVDANRRFCEMTGYTAQELRQLASRDITHPDDIAIDVDQAEKISSGVISEFSLEKRFRKKDGTLVWTRVFVAPLDPSEAKPTMRIGVTEDITERKRAEEALRASLREKEALLKEVHHRVKNNLQVVTSLLRLEAGRTEQPATKSVLKVMQGRIQAMALLHETLYRSGTFASVDLGAYLNQVAGQSFRALNSQPGCIRLEMDLASIRVEMDHAIPCGLLVNELISNSLKHGFPSGRTGEIRVELNPQGDGRHIRVSLSDTGVGLPTDFELRRGRSLGLQLASDLAKQLGGRLEVGAGPGARFDLTFAKDPSKASTLDAIQSPFSE